MTLPSDDNICQLIVREWMPIHSPPEPALALQITMDDQDPPLLYNLMSTNTEAICATHADMVGGLCTIQECQRPTSPNSTTPERSSFFRSAPSSSNNNTTPEKVSFFRSKSKDPNSEVSKNETSRQTTRSNETYHHHHRQPTLNETCRETKEIDTYRQTKLNVIDKNPSIHQMMNTRMRQASRYGHNWNILAMEIKGFLDDLKIIDVRHEIKAHKLVIADGSSTWFGYSVRNKTSSRRHRKGLSFSAIEAPDDHHWSLTATTMAESSYGDAWGYWGGNPKPKKEHSHTRTSSWGSYRLA